MSMRNPDNPFVLNEYYFVNLTSLAYNQTNLYYIHTVNNVLAFLIGTCLVILLAYCINKKTPPNFLPYSKMLWLCVCSDTVALIVNFCLQTVSPFRVFILTFIKHSVFRESVYRTVLYCCNYVDLLHTYHIIRNHR